MMNYVLADYKRVITRIPRIIFLFIYEAIFMIFVLNKWSKAAGNYNSIALLDNSSTFFAFWFTYVVCMADFIQSFSFDFSAKTIQVALGIGITRLQVILCKLIQCALVMLTDFLITFGVFSILCAITGTSMAAHQLTFIIYNGLGSILLVIVSVSLLLPLVFRTQNMVMSMVSYIVLAVGLFSSALRWISRLGPAFLARLQLDQLTHDSCANTVLTNALTGNFQLMPWIGVIVWFVLGVYLTWLAFRKMELDF